MNAPRGRGYLLCDMANPYHPAVGDNLSDGTVDTASGGTAFIFDPAIGTVLTGDGTTYKLGAIGVHPNNVDDPDLARALNALAFNDEPRWPESGGSNIPLQVRLVDAPAANMVVNFMGLAAGMISGIPQYPASYAGLAGTDDATHRYVTSPPSAGTVPYVNPAGVGNPDAIIALNYLLDDSDFKL